MSLFSWTNDEQVEEILLINSFHRYFLITLLVGGDGEVNRRGKLLEQQLPGIPNISVSNLELEIEILEWES